MTTILTDVERAAICRVAAGDKAFLDDARAAFHRAAPKHGIEDLVERFMDEAMSSGLSWDEAVAVFGFGAKAAAQAAAMAGEGDISECVALARRRFEDAFAQEVRVIVADADSAHELPASTLGTSSWCFP